VLSWLTPLECALPVLAAYTHDRRDEKLFGWASSTTSAHRKLQLDFLGKKADHLS
jgi:hypothetical protein